MKTYIDPEDYLTKVKCDYCKIGVSVYEAVELLRKENDQIVEILVGHKKCMESLKNL